MNEPGARDPSSSSSPDRSARSDVGSESRSAGYSGDNRARASSTVTGPQSGRFRRFLRSPLGIFAIICLLGAVGVAIYTWAQVKVIPRAPSPINVDGPGCYSSAGCGNGKPQSAPSQDGVSLAIANSTKTSPGGSREPGIPGSLPVYAAMTSAARSLGLSTKLGTNNKQVPGVSDPSTSPPPSTPPVTSHVTNSSHSTFSPAGVTGTSSLPGDPASQSSLPVDSLDQSSTLATGGSTTQPGLSLAGGGSPSPTTQAPASPQLPLITPSPQPAFSQDAPDPDMFVYKGVYYALTTGTIWGNWIGALRCAGRLCPYSGWEPADGLATGSTALPYLPGWETPNTQTSPGVIDISGTWTMYYDAVDTSNGHYCISVATSRDPTGPYIDSSTGPLICQVSYGGSIDPQPFQDSSGQIWLDWKTNDGSSTQPAWLWAQEVSGNGTSLVGPASQILFQDMFNHPWEATIENPEMIENAGTYYLFFPGGLWDSGGYGEGYAVCSSPQGPCVQPQSGPILFSYGSNQVPGGQVLGPGGGMAFFDPSQGEWFFAYAAWDNNCTSYGCGGSRELYLGALNFQ